MVTAGAGDVDASNVTPIKTFKRRLRSNSSPLDNNKDVAGSVEPSSKKLKSSPPQAPGCKSAAPADLSDIPSAQQSTPQKSTPHPKPSSQQSTPQKNTPQPKPSAQQSTPQKSTPQPKPKPSPASKAQQQQHKKDGQQSTPAAGGKADAPIEMQQPSPCNQQERQQQGQKGKQHAKLTGKQTAPGEAQQPSTSNQQHQQQQSTARCQSQVMIDHLRRRLLDPRSQEAAQMPLRKAAQQVYDNLLQVVTNTVTLGHSVSMVIYGEPGTGKTLVVERVLSQVCTTHNTDHTNPVVGVVRLSGVIHGEERCAFQEAARQLCAAFGGTFSRSASYDENLAFLRLLLQALARAHKSVVFVLDHLEMYVKKTKQVLLYNLLDVLQSEGVQAAVIGLTGWQDVRGAMEKRVRSRFSGRQLLLPSLEGFKEAGEVMRAMLEFRAEGLCAASGAASVSESGSRSGSGAAAGAGTVVGAGPAPGSALGLASGSGAAAGVMAGAVSAAGVGQEGAARGGLEAGWLKKWNTEMALVVREEAVETALRTRANFGFTPRDMCQALLHALLQWQTSSSWRTTLPSPKHLVAGVTTLQAPESSQVDVAVGLSVVELYVLVCMLRLAAKGRTVANFEMVADEYSGVKQLAPVDFFQKPAVFRCFQRIIAAGLASYTSSRAEQRGVMLQYEGVMLQIARSEAALALRRHPHCPDALTRWFEEGTVGLV